VYFGINSVHGHVGGVLMSVCHLALWTNPTEVMGNLTDGLNTSIYHAWYIYRFKYLYSYILTAKAHQLRCTPGMLSTKNILKEFSPPIGRGSNHYLNLPGKYLKK